ncbi:hypothetical protein [Agrobacterium cavarae]|uniref:hypothetical protein n=1 Tax=Agrobacterium cavarae TaxID=2528239 RepID=UPI003FD60832
MVEDISETDDPTLVGENCHIVGEKEDGPRGNSPLSLAERNRYSNLILLCNIHHKIIDDNEGKWTVGALHELKQKHEDWVEQSLGLDQVKLREDMIYADYIDDWARLAHLDNWTGWTSFVLGSGQPRIRPDVEADLGTLRQWLLARVWPGRYKTLEAAFENFRRVLSDFHETLRAHLEERKGSEFLFTEKFYKIPHWDPALYQQLSEKYDFHVALVCDLMLELTRAANLVTDEIRRHVAHSYRLKEGYLVVSQGPYALLQFVESVPKYRAEEISTGIPYPGLDAFYDERADRDRCEGKGRPPR